MSARKAKGEDEHEGEPEDEDEIKPSPRDGARGFTLFYRKAKRRWVTSAPDSFGVWRQKFLPPEFRARDARAAERWARDFHAGKRPAGRAPDGPTVHDAIDRWLKQRELDTTPRENERARFKPSTVRDNAVHLRKYVDPKFGDQRLAHVVENVPAVRDFVRDLRRNSGLSATRVRNVCATFRTFIDDMKVDLRLGDNPMRLPAITRELPPLPTRKPRIVPLAVAQALLDSEAVPMARRVRYALVFTGGLADGEVSGLQWRDLDPERGTLTIDRAMLLVSTVSKRVRVDPATRLSDPKNEHRKRTIPVHPAALAALAAWRAGGCMLILGRDPKPADPIFPGPSGAHARPASAKLLRRDIVRAYVPNADKPVEAMTDEERAAREALRAHAAALAHGVTFHALRRSFLSYLAHAHVPQEIRKRLAGHSKGDVTEEHYTDRELSELREAVERIALVWRAVTTNTIEVSS